ncbi:MAG: hypothetical protein GY760_04120 [Deltaproteobacteria bacterium]|nr:hypothetical protein [Deltaproteobacteria bacterium]
MKKRYLKIVILLVTLSFISTSCKELQKMVSMEVTPAQKQVIYNKAKSLKFKKIKKIRKSSTNRQTLKKGQWVTYLTEMKAADKDVTLTTVRVIKVSRGTVILETETLSASKNNEPTITQVTYRNYPTRQKLSYTGKSHRKIFRNVKIVRMRTKSGNDQVREVPQQILAMGTMGSKNLSQVRSGRLIAKSYATKYIKTKRCYSYNYNVSVAGFTDSGSVYAHSSVPILGYIKVMSGSADMTVISFGYRGARSKM